MLLSRFVLGVAVLNGLIYAIGGLTNEPKDGNTVEQYDPVKNVWKFVAPMNKIRLNASVAVLNGNIYVLGGMSIDENPTLEYYDAKMDKWTTVISFYRITINKAVNNVINYSDFHKNVSAHY